VQPLRLSYPVHTIGGQLLLPAGTVLSPGTLEELISSNRAAPYPASSLLGHRMVKDDMLRLMNRPPYGTIFPDEEKIAKVMMLMEPVRLVAPILESLDYFKEHDYHTYCHVLMVFALVTLIARDLMPDHGEWIHDVATSPTHDIGKTCAPPHILKKQTPLTKAEKGMLDEHATAGYVLLSYYHKDQENFAAIVARDHHERRDGSGKPRGIELTDRMVEIVAACDVYDALISPRPYRPVAYDNRTALEEITRMAESKKIGWDVVRALVAHNRKGHADPESTEVSLEKRGLPPRDNYYGVIEEDRGNDSPSG